VEQINLFDTSGKVSSPLSRIINIMSSTGCTRVLIKRLADNDNSKNQVYFGPGFEAINYFPNLNITPDKNGVFKASMDFSWIDSKGNIFKAPGAKIILYAQYPEVRFSGFLQGCKNAPSELMAARMAGRLLLLGIRVDGKVFGHVVSPRSNLAREFALLRDLPQVGVFNEISIAGKVAVTNSRVLLLSELKKIHDKGWIASKRLDSSRSILPCNAPNCGGLTLEAELGITPNGFSEPDFLGWEVKQHNVNNFARLTSGVITLMTPEPKGGYYSSAGVEAFIRRYGYPDKSGIVDRLNFGGVHVANIRHAVTGLTMKLIGYDELNGKIKDENGFLGLIRGEDEVAAAWHFADLLRHWNRKHNQAAYVPSMKRKESVLQYQYGNVVRLCEGTDFLRLLKAFASGKVYYDPGIKLEHASEPSLKRTKRRSQFRVKSKDIESLYKSMVNVDLTEQTED